MQLYKQLGTVKPPHYPYGLPEFPRANRERTLYTRNCILSHLNRELDEDRVEWHGTTVASAALGQMHGVAKGAHLVPVKQAGNEMVHVAEALDTAIEHITFYGLERSSVVVLPMGSALRTDPLTVIQTHLGARYMYRALDGMFNKGIPVISPAGNDRKAGRDQIDFYPGYWTANEFPLINVAETDHDGIRSEDSQAGEFVTTWAPTSPASVMYGDGTSHEESGTSIGKPSNIFRGIPCKTITDTRTRSWVRCRRRRCCHGF